MKIHYLITIGSPNDKEGAGSRDTKNTEYDDPDSENDTAKKDDEEEEEDEDDEVVKESETFKK